MGKKLFVGNLSFDTTSEELQTLFSEVGTCESANVVTDRDTGRSRGFGFVEMSSASEAGQAISTLNGREIGGRQINVNEAKPREGGGGGGGRGPRNGGGFSNRRSY
jgi:RNA recognition motif-containing protein